MLSVDDLPSRFIEKFWEKTTPAGPDDCWLWEGKRLPGGYGQVSVGRRYLYVHRISAALHIGPIPDGMTVDHRCFTRNCVNPAHLQIVTMRWNAGNRQRPLVTHCVEGHPMRVVTDPKGLRRATCPQCILTRGRVPVTCGECGRTMQQSTLRHHRQNYCKGGAAQ